MEIHLNITFPRIPCELLTLDVMDVSGEQQTGVVHGVSKVRLAPTSQGGGVIDIKALDLSVYSPTWVSVWTNIHVVTLQMTKQLTSILLIAVGATARIHQPTRKSQAAAILATKSERRMLHSLGRLEEGRTWNSVSESIMAKDWMRKEKRGVG